MIVLQKHLAGKSVVPEPKISLSNILRIVQEIVDNKGIEIVIGVDTELYDSGILESIDVLSLFLKIERCDVNMSHLKTYKSISCKIIYESL